MINTYELIETKKFRITFKSPVFGYFIFFKMFLGIRADGGHWSLHVLTNIVKFTFLLIPVIVLDIVTSVPVFLIIKSYEEIIKVISKVISKIFKKTTDTVFTIIRRLVTYLIVIILLISLIFNFDTWVKLVKILSDIVSSLL